jgi:hypothetical protein
VGRLEAVLLLSRRARLLALAVAVLAAGGCGGGGGDETFERDAFPFTFTYPGEFDEATEITIGSSAGGTAVAREGIGLDEDNLIVVTGYDLRVAITKSNLADVKAELDAVVGQVAGRKVSGAESEAGGLPGYEYTFAVSDPEDGRSRFVALFDGKAEYTINCQSTPDRRDEVEAACRQVLETLQPA